MFKIFLVIDKLVLKKNEIDIMMNINVLVDSIYKLNKQYIYQIFKFKLFKIRGGGSSFINEPPNKIIELLVMEIITSTYRKVLLLKHNIWKLIWFFVSSLKMLATKSEIDL